MLSSDDLAKLRKAGSVAAAARDIGMGMVAEGVKLYDVAEEVESYIKSKGCGLAFPCNISINEIAAHYTPSSNDKSVFEIG
ncbi:MAG: M24 family metallopeptidase, partial [Candidatus Methanomethylophilaceae archaeon]|nr:M24 family metallopeptidase [Candidatus Methanomethylophilaceae archaeon]